MILAPLLSPSARGSAVLVLTLVLGGCAGKVQTTHTDPGFSAASVARDGLGVAGVVLAEKLTNDSGALPPQSVPRDDLLAQSDEWTPELYRQLLARAGRSTLWPWAAVRDACGDSVLIPSLTATARANRLEPEELEPLAECIRQVRYLAYARVESDEVSVEHLGSGTAENPQVRDNRDPHAAERNAIVKTRRQVAVTLEIYDLERGRMVWSATVRRQRDELYDFNAASADRKQDVVPQGEPVITATGRAVPAPEFAQVFADACGALADRLLPEAKP